MAVLKAVVMTWDFRAPDGWTLVGMKPRFVDWCEGSEIETPPSNEVAIALEPDQHDDLHSALTAASLDPVIGQLTLTKFRLRFPRCEDTVIFKLFWDGSR